MTDRAAPQTPERIAKRVQRSVMRTAKILADLRQDPALLAAVDPHLAAGIVEILRDETAAYLVATDPDNDAAASGAADYDENEDALIRQADESVARSRIAGPGIVFEPSDPEAEVPMRPLDVPREPGTVNFRVEIVPHDWANDGQGYCSGTDIPASVATILRAYARQAEDFTGIKGGAQKPGVDHLLPYAATVTVEQVERRAAYLQATDGNEREWLELEHVVLEAVAIGQLSGNDAQRAAVIAWNAVKIASE